ncbi:MAG: hypothetical protein J2P36_22930 [Ktedonobacteraceae bacterium]|nr:hypothetical protein [Ktedonobacteraceae bacterium]
MPNKYEREINEILRNLEDAEPGQKLSERLRRKSRSRTPARQHRSISMNFSATEWLLIVAVTAALIAGGYAYIIRTQDLLSVALAIVSIICLLLVALSPFIFRPRQPSSVRYGTYGNVTVTPLRRNPFSNLKTRWNLFLLKIRYRRRSDQ